MSDRQVATITSRRLLLMALWSTAVILVASSWGLRPVDADDGDALVLRPKWYHVIVKPGDTPLINLTAQNTGDMPLAFSLEVLQTPGPLWKVQIRGALTSYRVRGVSLGPRDTRSLPMDFKVPSSARPGNYRFVIRAGAVDGSFEKLIPLIFTVAAAEAPVTTRVVPRGVELDAPRFRSLTGPADSNFEFSVALRNGTDEVIDLDLDGNAPDRWLMSFVPSLKDIQSVSSISLNPGASETITVRVRPPGDVDPGQYGIQFVASGPGVQLSTIFEVAISGTVELEIRTASGLLTAETASGQQIAVDIEVANLGTTLLPSLALVSNAPEGWEVTFDPNTITFIGRDEVRESAAQVVPAADAQPGDYRVTLSARSEGAAESVDLLVTITETSVLGWVVAAVVSVVLFGTGGLFLRLRRR